MNYETLDLKLKNLIQDCKETGNLKKLAVVSFILTSNKLNEIGIRLGLKQRNKNSGEKLFEYMEKINNFLESNLVICIFKQEQIELLRDCEFLFLRSKGDLPYDSIKAMFKVYYELRELDVPNLHRKMDDHDLVNVSRYGLQAFLSPASKRKRDNGSSMLKPLIVQKIKEKQLLLKKQSQNTFNGYMLEQAISLKKVQNSLNNNGKQNKIKFEGALKDNLNYQQSIEHIVGYFIIGVTILLFTLGMSMFLKLMTSPDLPSLLNYWSLMFVGGGAILLFVYIKYFIRGRY